MKKVAIVLVVIMVIGILAGCAYAFSDGFKKVPWEKDPTIESNILNESKDLLNNHASITFGEGDTAWTISTKDKLEPIYIDDLRAPGKGVEIGKDYYGNASETMPSLDNVSVDGINLVSINISSLSSYSSSRGHGCILSRKNNEFNWANCSSRLFENIIYAMDGESYAYDNLETKIKNEGYSAGDNYLLGKYQVIFEFKNIEKNGELSNLDNNNKLDYSTVIILNIPVYYRVK